MSSKLIRTITESELKIEVQAGRVSGGKVIETAHGFQLVFIVAGREWFLASRREPNVPRAYRTFELLTAKYRALYPNGAEKLTFVFSEPFEKKPSLKKRSKKQR